MQSKLLFWASHRWEKQRSVASPHWRRFFSFCVSHGHLPWWQTRFLTANQRWEMTAASTDRQTLCKSSVYEVYPILPPVSYSKIWQNNFKSHWNTTNCWNFFLVNKLNFNSQTLTLVISSTTIYLIHISIRLKQKFSSFYMLFIQSRSIFAFQETQKANYFHNDFLSTASVRSTSSQGEVCVRFSSDVTQTALV